MTYVRLIPLPSSDSCNPNYMKATLSSRNTLPNFSLQAQWNALHMVLEQLVNVVWFVLSHKWWNRSHVWEDGWTHFRMENWCYHVIRSSCFRCHPDRKPSAFCMLQQTSPTNVPHPPLLQWPHWPVLTVLTAQWFEWEMSPIGSGSLHPVWGTVWEFCRCGKLMDWSRT